MAEQNTVTVESLSASPLEPVTPPEEETVAVEQPAVQPEAVPAQPDVAMPQPVSEPVLEEADPQSVLSSLQSLISSGPIQRENAVPVTGETPTREVLFPTPLVPELPVILPKSVSDRLKDGQLGDAQKRSEAFQQMGDVYFRGLFSTKNAEKDNARKDAINSALAFAIPKVDAAGVPILNPDPNGRTKYLYTKMIPFPATASSLEQRVVAMVEAIPNPTGIYHLIDQNGPRDPIIMDMFQTYDKKGRQIPGPMGRARILQERQSPYTAFFARLESEEGGMQNYMDIVSQVTSDPARQAYYLKQQADTTPLRGIESVRIGANIKDMEYLVKSLAVGGLEKQHDFTAAIPFYWYAATGELNNAFTGERLPYDKIIEPASKKISEITRGQVDYYDFKTAAEKLAEAADVPVSEAEALLGYSPDLLTYGVRTTAETLATGVPILGVSRSLAANESAKVADFIMTEARAKAKELGWNTPKWATDNLGKQGIETIDDAVRVLEKAGLDSAKVMKDYVDKVGGGAIARAYVADALDLDIQSRAMLPGPFRESFFKQRVEALSAKITDLDAKIEAGIKANRTPQYIRRLKKDRREAQNTILDIKEKTVIPRPVYKFVRDEGIATSLAAVGYQAVYELSGKEEFKASIGGMLTAVLLGSPSGYNWMKAKGEDLLNYAQLRGDPEALKTRRGVVRLRRNLEKAPPELREQVEAFAQHRMMAREELKKFVFPEGHERAGQQIISEETFDEAFYRMSGLLSLKDIRTTALRYTLDVQDDAGKFSDRLATIETALQNETALMGESAELFANFKYLLLTGQVDADSPLADFATTYTQFYQRNMDELNSNIARVNEVLEDRETLFNAFLTGSLESDEMASLLIGKGALYDLIKADEARFLVKRYNEDAFKNLPPNQRLQRQAEIQQEYYRTLQKRLTAAAKSKTMRFSFVDNDVTANANFSAFLIKNESEAYRDAVAKIDAVRDNPEFKNARIDMTDIFDQMIARKDDDRLVFDETALDKLTEIGGEGTYESRFLNNLNIPVATQRGVGRLFENAAEEYIESLYTSGFNAEQLDELLETAGVANGKAIDKFLAVREFIEQNKEDIPAELLERVKPRLGLDVSQYMHTISALGFQAGAREGKRSAVAVSQLREQLLDRGYTQFYDNFYNPAQRNPTEGFGEAYADARAFYKKRYIDPFRNMSRTIPKIIRDEKTGTINPNGFIKFMDDMGLGKAERQTKDLKESIFPILQEITGGRPIDVSTDEGQFIRSLFSLYVADELARTPGGKKMQSLLLQRGSAYTDKYRSPLIIPENALEIEAQLQAGIDTATTTRMDNLLARDVNGDYIFADVNGKPLVDERLIDEIGFDAGLRFDPRFRDAEIRVAKDIRNESREIQKAFKKVASKEGQELQAIQKLAERLGQTEHGIGKGFVDLALQEDGLVQIQKLKKAYIDEQVLTNGVDAAVADEAFESVMRGRVIDYLTDSVLKPGNNKASRVYDAESGDYMAVVKRESVIDAPKLLEMLGFRGDRLESSRKEKIVRRLLGDEVWDHMKSIGNELFEYDPGTTSINVRGVSQPMSAESMLSRGTSFFRGVISARWLVSEAAIRASRMANLELTKLMLFDPKVGREIMESIVDGKIAVGKDTQPAWVRVLISQLAKNDAIQRLALSEGEQEGGESRIPPVLPPSIQEQLSNLMP